MRIGALLLLFFISFATHAQDPFLSFDHYLKNKKPSQIFAASFSEDEHFLLFIEDRKQVSVYNFDKTGKERKEGFSFPNFVKKYPNIGGYTYNGNDTYTLFLSALNKKKWGILTLDFKNKSYNLQETKLEIKKGRVLESLLYDDTQYIFVLKRDSSDFEVYALQADGSSTTQMYPFDDSYFSNGSRTLANLDRLLHETFTKSADIIDSEPPIALESSKSRTKFYQQDHLVTLTVDASKKKTHYLQFDLKGQTSSYKAIPKATFDDKLLSSKSNSFIFEDKLFVLKVSTEEMDFSITDLNTSENIASFSAQKGKPIGFKNTPIIQEGGEFKSYRELEKTSKFLRKVATSNPAIAVFKDNGRYIITLGATKEIVQGGPTFFIYGGGLAGAVAGGIITGIANATYYHYNAYSYTKSARFQMVLDQDFQFVIDAEIPLNAFDNISEFTQETPQTVLQTVFKFQDAFIWGALDAKNNKLNFFKF